MTTAALTGGAYQSRSVIAAAQRSVNLYAEPMPQAQGEPAPAADYPTPGLRFLRTLGTGPIRAVRQATTGGVYVVSGSAVYSVNPTTWDSTLLGHITAGLRTPVSLADNGLTMLIVDGTADGWTIDLASEIFLPVSDPTASFVGADRVDYLDTYLILNKPLTPQFYITNPLAITFDPLDFANKESYSDLLVTVCVAKRELYLLGQTTTEIWYNAGATNTGAGSFPFAEVQGVFIDHGCVAKYSVTEYDNAVFWLSRDRQGQGIVLMASDYKTTRVSTYAIEAAIAGYATISDAVGYSYQLGGHAYYVLTFPTADRTWVYDITTGLWHEWVWIDANGAEHRHRSNCHWPVNGMNVVGDWQNGNLYALDLETYTDNGGPIKRLRTFPHMLQGSARVFYRAFIADLETGNSPGVYTPPAPPSDTSWTPLPLAPGDVEGIAYAISADGHVAVGYTGGFGTNHACYWQDLANPVIINPASISEARGVSSDGSVIVGNLDGGQPWVWTAGGGLVSFSSSGDTVVGISANGTRIIGWTLTGALSLPTACYWDRPGLTRVLIGFLPGMSPAHNKSLPASVSSDGTYIVGGSEHREVPPIADNYQRGFLWTLAGGMINLGLPSGISPPCTTSDAFGVADDGSFVVGSGYNSGTVAWRWTLAGGSAAMPSLVPGSNYLANVVSADGSVIAGYDQSIDFDVSGYLFSYWTGAADAPPTQPTPVALNPAYPDVIQGYTFPTGVSADGKKFVGYVVDINPLPWLYQTSPAPTPTTATLDSNLISLSVSYDRGHSFGSPVTQSIGNVGEYSRSLQWRRLGYGRDAVFKLEWSVPMRTALQGAWITAEPSPTDNT